MGRLGGDRRDPAGPGEELGGPPDRPAPVAHGDERTHEAADHPMAKASARTENSTGEVAAALRPTRRQPMSWTVRTLEAPSRARQ